MLVSRAATEEDRMTPQLELEVFGHLAAAAVGIVIVTLGALHSARFVVRLVLFLLHELRAEVKLLADEIRPAVAQASLRNPERQQAAALPELPIQPHPQ
jgi:hypothetical protein